MWTDLYLAFTTGLDLSKSAVLSGPELKLAENVDWDHDGVIKGRPSRTAPAQFVVGGGAPQSFAATGYSPRGLIRVRNLTGEQPALVCEGRTFSLENGHWVDRAFGSCFRVDRKVNFLPGAASAAQCLACTQDFGPSNGYASLSSQSYWLLSPTGAIEGGAVGATGIGGSGLFGTGARCGTTTAIVGYDGFTGHLDFIYRTAGATALTKVQLATDAAGGTHSLPVICSSNGAGFFWIIYATSTTNQFKILRVDVTGNILSTYTGTHTGLVGFWLDNTAPAADQLIVALTNASGLTLRPFTATTIGPVAPSGLLDSTYSISGRPGIECVVGIKTNTTATWAYRSDGSLDFGDGDIVVGTVDLTVAASASQQATYYGGGVYPSAGVNWSICHQPVLCNGRLYLTLSAAQVTGAKTGTWITQDVTSVPFQVVARGPSNATMPVTMAGSAVPLADNTGWTFPTLDYSRFSTSLNSLTGLDALLGLNAVVLAKPREALVGESTIISGSIPHVMQRGQVAELGFPFLAGQPGLDATATAGGGLAIGDYTLAALWRWTDETGVIHRSSPSPLRTAHVPGSGTNTLLLTVTNPTLTEKEWGSLKIELYCSGLNAASDAAHYLVYSGPLSAGSSYTQVSLTSLPTELMSNPVLNPGTETLYTDGDEFANFHVPADGGVAALGRRVWLASGSTAYASKLLVPGKAPSFNDEGQLQINLPAGAGRILALESMDDKLVIFCARGVFVVRDGGPDNAGQGLDFGVPERVADLSIAGERATCLTSKGIVFLTPVNATNPQLGGPWLLSRGLDLQYLGRNVLDYLAGATEVAYSFAREAVFMNYDSGTTGVVMMDLRTMRWATWANQDTPDGALRSLACVSGDLWTLATEPSAYNGAPGTDAAGDYAMHIKTSHLYSNGKSGVGWARVRGMRVLGTPQAGNHTLTMSAVMDQVYTATSTPFTMTTPTASTSWPTSRQAPEWRLPTQKCASIQVDLVATPATAQWAAISLQVLPLPPTSPALQRA
jgi:hypothetical protein